MSMRWLSLVELSAVDVGFSVADVKQPIGRTLRQKPKSRRLKQTGQEPFGANPARGIHIISYVGSAIIVSHVQD